MEIKHGYVKTRSQFGKQCIFDDSDVTVEANLYPDFTLREKSIYMNPVDRGVQMSKQFALHEVQTDSVITKESGMNHTEGGWPKEINPRDEEAVSRYRRRIEKNDNWAPKMHYLMESMERYILQNNAINIYEHYFDDQIPPKIVSPSVRTVKVYKDAEKVVRPITHLSWSSDNGIRLAAAYCSIEFSKVPNNLSQHSYIWDIENPNKALMALRASHSSVTIEFNPRDPSLLISGLMSGQVCNWDIRSGNTPIMISHPEFSHKYPANCALWINSKTNSEFFSASTEGTIYWWDIRMLQKPTESLIMDLENSLQSNVVRATGVSALQYETTMGTKFMAGLENGLVINATRRAKTPAEKIAIRLECHHGPVITIDRNPFSMKNFLTVGDWSAKIWAEDTREGNLISTKQHNSILTGGCWSTSRCSVFYVINNDGIMEIFDILLGLKMPVMTTRLCEDSLKAIAPHMDGKLIAVGSDRGKIYLVESSDALTINLPNDRTLLSAFFERCSRYEKAVDNRIKETRLAQRVIHDESESSVPLSKVRVKSKNVPAKFDKDKKIDDKKKLEKDRKKSRHKKIKDIWALLGDSELANIERQYFETIEKEMEKYADAMAAKSEVLEETVSSWSIKETSTKRGKHDDLKVDKDGGRKRDSRKLHSLKGSVSKDKSARASKTTEIVIVKRKHDVTHEGNDDEKKVDKSETTGRTEIMGERVMVSEKTHERISESNEILETRQDKDNDLKNGVKKILSHSINKQMDELNLCDDGVCIPEICCLDQIVSSICSDEMEEINSTLDDIEEKKMNRLIQEMIASSPKNILPTQLEESPQYTNKEKKAILEENYAPPLLLTNVLKETKKEMRNVKKKMVNTPRLVHSESSTQIPIVINEVEKIEDKVKAIPEVPRINSIVVNNSDTSMETLELNKNVVTSQMSDDKTKSDITDCKPIVARFGSKEILSAIGVKKINLPKLSMQTTPSSKLNISLKKKKK